MVNSVKGHCLVCTANLTECRMIAALLIKISNASPWSYQCLTDELVWCKSCVGNAFLHTVYSSLWWRLILVPKSLWLTLKFSLQILSWPSDAHCWEDGIFWYILNQWIVIPFCLVQQTSLIMSVNVILIKCCFLHRSNMCHKLLLLLFLVDLFISGC